ncbi:hypothetical protein [Streptomyces chilikensis]|uniref:Integral membrane protein n=1 Tax=Streptomyces chilikensis TaxID=1194079 RepID=A0ABV3ERJ4_9ACTN
MSTYHAEWEGLVEEHAIEAEEQAMEAGGPEAVMLRAEGILASLGFFSWLGFAVVLPVIFLIFDEDRLRMSDDYAAMTSAAIALILTLGFLEVALFGKHTSSGVDDSGKTSEELATRLRKRTIGLILWLGTSTALVAALLLVFLWAAIDGHGPARWLAWYVWECIAWGVSLLLFVVAAHTRGDVKRARRRYLAQQKQAPGGDEAPADVASP